MQKFIKSKGKEPSAIAVADPGGGSGGLDWTRLFETEILPSTGSHITF